MRSFLAVLLIFLGTLAYGSVFVTDTNARKRELARLEALAITPPPGGGQIILEPDQENDAPDLSPRPAQVLKAAPFQAAPFPAPSPAPSRNEFRIDDQTQHAPSVGHSLFALLLGVTPAHAESVEVPTGERKPLAERQQGEIELQFTTGDGKAWAAYVRQQDASLFLQSTLRYIDERRDRTKEKLRVDIDQVLRDAFSDRYAAIEEFADWYYGFFTSGMLAGQGIWGGLQEVTSLDMELISGGVEIAVIEAIRHEFMTLVLKPELRDPIIQDGIRTAVMDAHSDYLRMIEGLDSRLIKFVGENARYVRPMDPREKVHLTLDWDSESWRAPLHYDREAVMFGAAGVLTTAGAMLAGDAIIEAVMSLLGAIVADAVVAAQAGAGGAAVGSEVPVVGTIVGAAAGLAVHGALNLFRDHMGRDTFVGDTNDALDATIKTWHNMIAPTSDQLVDRWFNETKRLVQTPQLESKLGS